MREQRRVAAAGRRLRAEDLDHADHRAEQAEQRRRRGDRAQRVEVALEPVHRGAPGGLEGVAQRASVMRGSAITAAQAGGEHGAEHRVVGELVDHVGRRAGCARVTEITSSSSRGGATARAAQAHEALDDQRPGPRSSTDQRPDRPAGGLYDRKQAGPFLMAASGWAARFRWRADYGVATGLPPSPNVCRSGSSSQPAWNAARTVHPMLWITLWATRVRTRRKLTQRRGPERIAERLSKIMFLQIKHLRHSDAA